ncbi:MAG: hypothetical protein AAF399_11150 [Bacteroidota bacterium]
MFGRNDSLAPQTSLEASASEKHQLEPHVEFFDLHSTRKGPFVLPFQVIFYCMIGLVALGFVGWIWLQDQTVVQLVVLIQLFFAPFFIPGLVYYFRFLKRERGVELELDSYHDWIKYYHEPSGTHLLFQSEQVESCTLHLSLIFPYKVDFLSLQLVGGPCVHISSLIISPEEMLERFPIPYEIQKRMFNPIPKLG